MIDAREILRIYGEELTAPLGAGAVLVNHPDYITGRIFTGNFCYLIILNLPIIEEGEMSSYPDINIGMYKVVDNVPEKEPIEELDIFYEEDPELFKQLADNMIATREEVDIAVNFISCTDPSEIQKVHFYEEQSV